MSGRMNWDRVNRENRAWRAASGNWEPHDSWKRYHKPEVDRRLRAEATRRWPMAEAENPTAPRGTGTSKAAQKRRRQRRRGGQG